MLLKTEFEHTAPNLAARSDVKEILRDRPVTDYMTSLVETLPFLKSPRFQEENEFRIVAIPSRLKSMDERAYKEVFFREGTGSIVPYVKLFEGSETKLPIKKIVVGPHRDQENQHNAARLLLDQHGWNVPIVRSDTTLRY